MGSRFVLALAVVGIATSGAAQADTTGDVLTLYPAGGGANTHADWRAQEGRADSEGAANQALLLQKETSDPSAAAAAHIRGLEGQRVTFLASLGFEYRRDTVCSETDPRFALFVKGESGREYLVNIGCRTMPVTPTDDPRWLRRTAATPLIRLLVMRRGGADALGGTISGLALVFDRSFGLSLLDNVSARSRLASKVWTFAGDNGNGVPPVDAGFSDGQRALLAEPLTADELMTDEELFASATDEELTLLNQDTES